MLAGIERPMPRYKNKKALVAELRPLVERAVARPVPALADDDELDAWVAWRLGTGLLAGECTVWGTRGGGHYVLPTAALEAG